VCPTEEKRKRDRATANAASPATAASGLVDDESPASKRAKVNASLNFLNAHADAAKNKQRNRGRPAGAKLDLTGLKTEKENMTKDGNAMDTSEDVKILTSMPPPAVPHGASVLSRFTHPLHFRYNDGCTNAVRRTVPIAHFLPL